MAPDDHLLGSVPRDDESGDQDVITGADHQPGRDIDGAGGREEEVERNRGSAVGIRGENLNVADDATGEKDMVWRFGAALKVGGESPRDYPGLGIRTSPGSATSVGSCQTDAEVAGATIV